MKFLKYGVFALAAFALAACSDDDPRIFGSDAIEIGTDKAGNGGDYRGFYLLNEGNMGANKCTLDYYDYTTGTYYRNIYSENNPNQVLELGDVGNDIAVYGNRLYIVVNGSHKVEVLDAETAIRIGQVEINSPREIAFDGNKAYVTSFGERGTVQRFDLETLKVDAQATVGYGPEDIVLHDGKLFVANSCNYGSGAYDNTITVLDPTTMGVDYTITTSASNLQKIVADQYGNLWVSSMGNYNDIPAKVIILKKGTDGRYAEDPMTLYANIGDMCYYDKEIYYYTTVYDASWNATYRFGAYDTASTNAGPIVNRFLDPQDMQKIQTPYCLTVNPSTGDFFVTDAKNYTSSGALYCYDKDWKLKWTVTTGDIPGHIASRAYRRFLCLFSELSQNFFCYYSFYKKTRYLCNHKYHFIMPMN